MSKDFVSDLHFENMEYAHIIRSFDADSKLLNIEKPELPAGVSFFSAADIKGKKNIIFFNAEIPVFADGKIEYSGQAVGILTGPDKKVLSELAPLFKIKTQSALKPKSQFTFEEEVKNYFDYPTIAKEFLSNGNTEDIFEKNKNVVYSTFSVKQKYHYHAETACVKTKWKNERLEIHIAAQWPVHILNSVSEVLNIPKEQINVVLHNEAESLDGRIWFPSLLAAQIAVASYLTKKNLSIQFTRQEDFLYTTKSPGVLIQHKTAVSNSGMIEAMNISIIADAGSFNPFICEILKQMTVTAAGIYNLPAYTVNAVAIKTNCGLTDLFMGWGDAYVTSALEKHINEIANTLNLCPVRFRLQNSLHAGHKRICGTKKNEDSEFENLFKTVCSTSDFYRKYYAHRLMNGGRKNRYDGNWRGIGIAAGLQYNGSNILVKSGMNYSAEITLTKDNMVCVKAEPTSAGLKKILCKYIAKELETDENAITFLSGSTDEMSNTGAGTASCGISIIPDLIGKCCTGIKNQRFRKPLPITVNKTYRVTKTKDWDNTLLTGTPFISETPAVCAIELLLNRSIYSIEIKGIWFACNPGKIYSKKTVMHSIHKSIANAISSISVEKIQERNILPSKYKIIPTGSIPPIRVFLAESESKACGIEELAEGLIPAAYISALNQIMLNYRRIDSVPVFTEDIFASFAANEAHREN